MERRVLTIPINEQGLEELSKLLGLMAQGFVPRFESAYLARQNAGEPDEVIFICLPVALESMPQGEQ